MQWTIWDEHADCRSACQGALGRDQDWCSVADGTVGKSHRVRLTGVLGEYLMYALLGCMILSLPAVYLCAGYALSPCMFSKS